MSKVEKDEVREHRIEMEIIVDAYNGEEQAMGWYYYLEDKLCFPFKARCIVERRLSPLKVGEEIQVVGMTSEEDCMHEMFVEARWSGRTFGMPLSQLEAIEADSETQQAIEDWHYWAAMGYQF